MAATSSAKKSERGWSVAEVHVCREQPRRGPKIAHAEVANEGGCMRDTSSQKTISSVVTVTEHETTVVTCHLEERWQDRDNEPDSDDVGLEFAAEVSPDPKVWISSRDDPHVPLLVEHRRQLSLRWPGKRRLRNRDWVTGIDVFDALF